METISITIQDEQLRQAAEKGIDEFIKVFTDSYMKTLGGELNLSLIHI